MKKPDLRLTFLGLVRYYFLPGKTLCSISATPDASKIKFEQIIDSNGNKESFIIKRKDLLPVEKGFQSCGELGVKPIKHFTWTMCHVYESLFMFESPYKFDQVQAVIPVYTNKNQACSRIFQIRLYEFPNEF